MQYLGGDDVGMKYNVPVQSLIDHIKTALDVDPWAKEMVEELLKEQEPTTFKPHYIDKYGKHFICGVECGSCHKEISSTYHYCPYCGRSVKWDD